MLEIHIPGLKYKKEMNQLSPTELRKKTDHLKKLIDTHRPLTDHEIKELYDYYRIGAAYASNAIEGNSLTISETKVIIEDGITIGGKPLRDCYEASGHAKAYDWMISIARGEKLQITEEMIQKLHRLFYSGIDSEKAGIYRKDQVFITGTEYLPPEAEKVPEEMHLFLLELAQRTENKHPVEVAAFAHRRLVDIHPFTDGNGRTARLLMNMVLVNHGYCVVSIPPILRNEYISALHVAQRNMNRSDEPFFTLIFECEIEAQKDYCRMFRIPILHKTQSMEL